MCGPPCVEKHDGFGFSFFLVASFPTPDADVMVLSPYEPEKERYGV